MKQSRKRTVPETRPAAPQRWHVPAAFAASVVIALFIYGPALEGPFVFDDVYLPFMRQGAADMPLAGWLGVRKLLMFTYWVNYQISGVQTLTYHLFNVVLHGINAGLMWLVLRRFLERAGEAGRRRDLLAAVGAALFLCHPVQTESVAYVASRSEVLSVFFALLAMLVYLKPADQGIGWGRVAAILAFLGLGAMTKEHVVAVPAVILLADLIWHGREGVRRNWRLYSGLVAGAIAGAAGIWAVLRDAPTVGFGLKNLAWYEYLFTQFRVIWTYIRFYVLPVGLNIDHDVPLSRTLFEHGAVVWLIGLAGLVAAAVLLRRRYPLAALGVLAFLILLAPTSSVVPIRDVIAERRLYLPFIGLLLVTLDFLRRVRWPDSRYGAVIAGVVVVLGYATFARSAVWADPQELWRDAASKSPNKTRPRFQLAYAAYSAGRCSDAAEHYSAVAKLDKPDYHLLVDWALALDCANRPDEALARLEEAARLEPTAHVYATIGMIHGKHNRTGPALAALAQAEKANPRFSMTYVYRGNVHMLLGNGADAIADYERAIALDPRNQIARHALETARQRLRVAR